jgi:predicted TIM-barrel fold metal-dependent hydrolase
MQEIESTRFGSFPSAAGMSHDSIPIIDTHIHFFDPRRPQGVPWPESSNAVLYQPALPSRYRKVSEGLGIVGVIEVECSPWLEDNQWVLEIAAADNIVVGTVGDLEPGQPGFRNHLERFCGNPLFRGIRCGNLWGRDLAEQISDPQFVSDLRELADAGLTLDTANPNAALIAAVVRITEKIPHLRVVIDHLPQMDPPSDREARSRVRADLQELGSRPQVYAKVSEVLRRVGGRVPGTTNFYLDRLDQLWEVFGPDRLLFGSDWPHSDLWGTLPEVVNIVKGYFLGRDRAAAESYFWRNSIAAYRWTRRDYSQPQLSAE